MEVHPPPQTAPVADPEQSLEVAEGVIEVDQLGLF
jgi:hypothetical protein